MKFDLITVLCRPLRRGGVSTWCVTRTRLSEGRPKKRPPRPHPISVDRVLHPPNRGRLRVAGERADERGRGRTRVIHGKGAGNPRRPRGPQVPGPVAGGRNQRAPRHVQRDQPAFMPAGCKGSADVGGWVALDGGGRPGLKFVRRAHRRPEAAGARPFSSTGRQGPSARWTVKRVPGPVAFGVAREGGAQRVGGRWRRGCGQGQGARAAGRRKRVPGPIQATGGRGFDPASPVAVRCPACQLSRGAPSRALRGRGPRQARAPRTTGGGWAGQAPPRGARGAGRGRRGGRIARGRRAGGRGGSCHFCQSQAPWERRREPPGGGGPSRRGGRCLPDVSPGLCQGQAAMSLARVRGLRGAAIHPGAGRSGGPVPELGQQKAPEPLGGRPWSRATSSRVCWVAPFRAKAPRLGQWAKRPRGDPQRRRAVGKGPRWGPGSACSGCRAAGRAHRRKKVSWARGAARHGCPGFAQRASSQGWWFW
ncbi:hypothetical protein TNIN_500441 [Trichonephila inaurata madagascariensis]|uniref:Uncharacterized protein n=1 Tax=Trichonephila inaurata madagascariensis TaxID=2747483 RepID=A0A8X6XH24_9ARAC|nr:hypothetical protein TNIN_500441 [Trichonephila inaurata madagascariensis]